MTNTRTDARMGFALQQDVYDRFHELSEKLGANPTKILSALILFSEPEDIAPKLEMLERHRKERKASIKALRNLTPAQIEALLKKIDE